MLLQEAYGFVYLFDTKSKGYKIGKTKNIEQRMDYLKMLYPDGVLLHTVETNVNFRLEKDIQNKFKSKKREGKGELFNLLPCDILYIKSFNKVFYIKDPDEKVIAHLKYLLQKHQWSIEYDYWAKDKLTKKEVLFIKEHINIFDPIRNKVDKLIAQDIIDELFIEGDF